MTIGAGIGIEKQRVGASGHTAETLAFQTRADALGADYYDLDAADVFINDLDDRGLLPSLIAARAKFTGYKIGSAADKVSILLDLRADGNLDRLQATATKQFTVNTTTHVISSDGTASKNMASVDGAVTMTLPITIFLIADFSALANGKCLIGADGGKLNIYNNGGQLSCADGGVDFNVGAVPAGREIMYFIKNGASSKGKIGLAGTLQSGNGGTREPLGLVAGAFGDTGSGAASCPDFGLLVIINGALSEAVCDGVAASFIAQGL